MSHSPRWKAWEKTRTKGKPRFVLRMALVWGLLMAGLMTAVHTFSTPGASILTDLLGNLFVFLAAGILFGILMWNRLEASYRNYLSREELQAIGEPDARR